MAQRIDRWEELSIFLVRNWSLGRRADFFPSTIDLWEHSSISLGAFVEGEPTEHIWERGVVSDFLFLPLTKRTVL